MKRRLLICLILAVCLLLPAATAAADNTGITGTVTVVIFNTLVSDISYHSATVSWTTNSPSDSQVEYGTTIGYGLTTPLLTGPGTNHIVQLVRLMSGATYHFRVRSGNADGTAFSSDYTFSTPYSPSGYSDGGGSGGGTTVLTSVFGDTSGLPLDGSGLVQQDRVYKSADGKVQLNVPAGTNADDAEGNPITSLTALINPNPPPAPPGKYDIIAVEFGPSGATFNPPIVLTFNYDLAALADQGISEDSLVIGFYDTMVTPLTWVFYAPPQINIDKVNHIVTLSVDHFSTYILIGTPASTPPPTASPTPTQILTPTLTPTPTSKPTPTPTQTSTPTTSQPFNWTLVGMVVLAVTVVVVLIILLIWRRKRGQT
jgi:hypothetical protein